MALERAPPRVLGGLRSVLMTEIPFRLYFRGSANWEELRSAWSEVVTALRGTSSEWQQVEKSETEDIWVPSPPFETLWKQPGAIWRESVRRGSGNPRDGYGYDMKGTLELETADGLVKVRLAGSSWEPRPDRLDLWVYGASPAQVVSIRTALRGALGAERDISGKPWIAQDNVRYAMAVDRDVARRWLGESLSGGKPEGAAYGWAALLSLKEELDGPSAKRLDRRLREAPQDVSAWERALVELPPAWSRERVTAILHRLRPYDPKAKSPPWDRVEPNSGPWRRLENGIGPSGSENPLVWNLTRALFPGLVESDSHFVAPEKVGQVILSADIRAVWADSRDELPLALVCRTALRKSRRRTAKNPIASSGSCRQGWWLYGEEAGDVVRLVMEWTRYKNTKLHLGVALAVSGSETFRLRVEKAIEEVTPYRFDPIEGDKFFIERKPRKYAGLEGEGSSRERVARLLEKVDAATPEILEIVAECSCAQPRVGYCVHAKTLLEESRRWRGISRESKAPRESLFATAREQALLCALYVIDTRARGANPEMYAKQSSMYLAMAEAIR